MSGPICSLCLQPVPEASLQPTAMDGPCCASCRSDDGAAAPVTECRRCSECVGEKHHFAESCTTIDPETGVVTFECKHCDYKCEGVECECCDEFVPIDGTVVMQSGERWCLLCVETDVRGDGSDSDYEAPDSGSRPRA